jgi:hypothetical protein
MKWWKAGLENLVISPRMKKGIGKRVIKDDRRGE